MTDFLQNYITELWRLVQEMAPWLLLGLIFAGLLKIFFPEQKVQQYLGKSNFKSVFNAAIIGIPMPLCSCGVIPTGISFFQNGASKGATNSFLISTPQTGVDSILATYSMLGWPFAVLRPVVALATGLIGGIFTNFYAKEAKIDTKKPALQDTADSCANGNCGCKTKKQKSTNKFLTAADYAFVELLQDIAKWLIIGFLLAALISVLLPPDFFSMFKGWGIAELLIILVASIPLYVCATGSIPIAAVLLMKGISPGAAMVFLMAGPATNVATITVLGKIMGKKSLTAYLISIIGGALLFGLLINWLIPQNWILSRITHLNHEHSEMLPSWLEFCTTIFLITAMIVGCFYNKYKRNINIKKMKGTTIKVSGMTCSHCEANIKRNLEKLEGITEVVADRHNETVKIEGENIGIAQAEKIVNDLGYEFKGEL